MWCCSGALLRQTASRFMDSPLTVRRRGSVETVGGKTCWPIWSRTVCMTTTFRRDPAAPVNKPACGFIHGNQPRVLIEDLHQDLSRANSASRSCKTTEDRLPLRMIRRQRHFIIRGDGKCLEALGCALSSRVCIRGIGTHCGHSSGSMVS